jgi:WD40 repeat protein
MVAVWNARDLSPTARLREHDDSVRAVVFSPDGRRLASGSVDRTIRLWETERFEPVCTLRGHGGWVMGLAWTPDGTRLYSGSNDASIRVWDRRPASERRSARGTPAEASAARTK